MNRTNGIIWYDRKLARIDFDNGSSDWYFYCPACQSGHYYRTPLWTFNGNTSLPTFSPSLKISQLVRRGGVPVEPKVEIVECHLHLVDGKIIYTDDCPHQMRGQTVEMQDWPENYGLT